MSKKYRLSFLAISFVLLVIIGYLINRNFLFLVSDFWFTSGLLLLILLSLIDQPFFSKDTNIFVNAVTAFISLQLVIKEERKFFYWLIFAYVMYLMVTSYLLMWVRNNPLKNENKLIQLGSRLNRLIGNPQVVFSVLFLFGIIKQFATETPQFNGLLSYWIAFQILNIPEVAKVIEKFLTKNQVVNNGKLIGETLGVLSKNIFLVKRLEKSEIAHPFDFVEFNYSVDGIDRYGIVLENYLLNQEQWIKIIASPEVEALVAREHTNRAPNFVYKIEELGAASVKFRESFVGIIVDNTVIEKIRFQYLGSTEVCQGQLLELKVGSHSIYYQILEGIIKTEVLDNKDETSMVIGEAFQLGEWVEDRCCFEQFGWIPDINTPVFLASNVTSKSTLDCNECVIGSIPNTKFNVIMNCKTAITHHMAILGVTGSGKSVFARQVIRKYLNIPKVRVICVDFTGEHAQRFQDLHPYAFGTKQQTDELISNIGKMLDTIAANYNKENQRSLELRDSVINTLEELITTFLQQDVTNIGIFELPEIDNSIGIMTYIQYFFKAVFNIAKKYNNHGKRVSLVLEEAHTIIPEGNFSGINEKASQPILNSIAQIALQGRKYNIGLLVIAQRSANVSKTILTQCNSMVTFQGFDKTSSDFLSAYFGTQVASSISRLKFRQAYVVGKAFRSSVPMLFEVPFIQAEQEPEPENEALIGGVLRPGAPFAIAYPTPRTVDPTTPSTDV